MLDANRRTERRDFIRAHHPDRGGDPADFIAGLREFERGPTRDEALGALPRVTVYSAGVWPVRLATRVIRKINKPRPRVR